MTDHHMFIPGDVVCVPTCYAEDHPNPILSVTKDLVAHRERGDIGRVVEVDLLDHIEHQSVRVVWQGEEDTYYYPSVINGEELLFIAHVPPPEKSLCRGDILIYADAVEPAKIAVVTAPCEPSDKEHLLFFDLDPDFSEKLLRRGPETGEMHVRIGNIEGSITVNT